MLKRIKKVRYYIFLFIFPALIIYTGFLAVPLFNSLRLSFYTGPGLAPSEFVGFQNYIKLFTQPPFSERFLNAFLNTLEFFFIIVIAQNLIGFILSVIVTKNFFGARFFRIAFYIPTTLSVLVVGFLFSLILNPVFGIFDKFLEFLNLGFLVRPWLADKILALPIISIITSWHHLGTPILFFTAAIDRIPDEVMEAAMADGVSEMGMVKHIILPFLVPTIKLITIMTFVADFIAFDIIYAMATVRGEPNYQTDVTGTFFYRSAFGDIAGGGPDMGFGAAVATVLFIFIVLGVTLIFSLFKNVEEEGLF